uniref:Uncharacterized protein n=1 Tax=Arundo donax TaxID=35708 RepID=A0A0A9CZ27_ARUDO
MYQLILEALALRLHLRTEFQNHFICFFVADQSWSHPHDEAAVLSSV